MHIFSKVFLGATVSSILAYYNSDRFKRLEPINWIKSKYPKESTEEICFESEIAPRFTDDGIPMKVLVRCITSEKEPLSLSQVYEFARKYQESPEMYFMGTHYMCIATQAEDKKREIGLRVQQECPGRYYYNY